MIFEIIELLWTKKAFSFDVRSQSVWTLILSDASVFFKSSETTFPAMHDKKLIFFSSWGFTEYQIALVPSRFWTPTHFKTPSPRVVSKQLCQIDPGQAQKRSLGMSSSSSEPTVVFVTCSLVFIVFQSILLKWLLVSRDQMQEPQVFLGGLVPLGLQAPLERMVSPVRWEFVVSLALRVPLALLA